MRLIGTHAGFAAHNEGSACQALEDVALFRALHGVQVFVPADARELGQVLDHLVLEREKPAYVRLGSERFGLLTADDHEFAPATAVPIRDGDDVTLVAAGSALGLALEAARRLHGEGVACRVLDFCSVSPLDHASLSSAARQTRGIVVVEEHSVTGGLAGAVAESVVRDHPCPVGVRGTLGESGGLEQLWEAHGLTADAVVLAARSLMERGRA